MASTVFPVLAFFVNCGLEYISLYMMRKFLLVIFFSCVLCGIAISQTGLTVGPPRIYFVADGGQSQTQFVDVTNPSKDYKLDLAVSFEDWEYSSLGDNVLSPNGTLSTSCGAWFSVSEPYFSLLPGETKKLQLNLQVPKGKMYSDSIPVHTSMLFVTQLNPRTTQEKEGANIRLALRSGIKLYQRFNGHNNEDLEITDLKLDKNIDSTKMLKLDFHVTGNIWMQGNFRVEFVNQDNGEKLTLDNLTFYCMPGDKRIQYIAIPKALKSGNYTATILAFFGESDNVKAAEIDFNHVQQH